MEKIISDNSGEITIEIKFFFSFSLKIVRNIY